MNTLIYFTKTNHTVYDLRQSNIDLFINALNNYNFQKLFDSQDINEKANILESACISTLKLIPHREVCLTINDKKWMTPKIKLMINDKWYAYRSKRFTIFNHLKQKIKIEIANAKHNFVNSRINDSKQLWKVVNDITGRVDKCNILNLLNDYPSECDLANAINKQFSEGFINSGKLPKIFAQNDEQNDCAISIDEVMHQLDNLKLSKASPKTDLPTRLYKEAKTILAAPLCNIFNTSIMTKTIPNSWKMAEIIPIPKSSPVEIKELRPVSILATPIKILEKIVLKNNKQSLLKNVDSAQYGFRPLSSTTCALLDIGEFVTKQLDLGRYS